MIQKLLSDGVMEICVNVIPCSESTVAVVILPGLNLSKSGPYFLLSKIARRCSEKGINVFQFDYYGEGDSSGSYEDMSLESVLCSVNMVKNYARQLGCEHFILIGYGMGNILAGMMADEDDTEGICFIAPDFTSYTKFDMVWEFSKKHKELCIHESHYLWPYTAEKELQKYWCSIIGIVEWLYHTPFNGELLKEISQVGIKKLNSKAGPKLLFINPQGQIPVIIPNRDYDVLHLSELHLRTREEWKNFTLWPQLWDDISIKIRSWVSRWGYSQEETKVHEPIRQNSRRVKRESIIFGSQQYELTGILHSPVISGKERFPCVIYEPGLGGSRVDIGRSGPLLGDTLASEGFLCLRYDSFGSGVSEGEFYEMSWEMRYNNIVNAIDFLKQLPMADAFNVFVVSYSAGSKVACMAARRLPEVKGCVMWSPHFLDDLDAKGKSNKPVLLDSKEIVMPMNGLWLNLKLLREEKHLNFVQLFKEIQKPFLVITGDDEKLDINIPFLLQNFEDCEQKEIIQFPGAHCFLYKYMESIMQATLEYLKKCVEGEI